MFSIVLFSFRLSRTMGHASPVSLRNVVLRIDKHNCGVFRVNFHSDLFWEFFGWISWPLRRLSLGERFAVAKALGGFYRLAVWLPWPPRYAFRKPSRSALMVSASVVGMPCGKPL